jgi:hypothetical protein
MASWLGCLLVLTTPLSTFAQAEAPDIDLEAISVDVIAVDPADLLTALETPIAGADLPDGFELAEYMDPVANPVYAYLASGEILPDPVGFVSYRIPGDPILIGGDDADAMVQYVVLEPDAVGDDPIADYETGALASIEGLPDTMEGEVEVVNLGEIDAVLITVSESDIMGTYILTQTLAFPVGNVFVLTLTSVIDYKEIEVEKAYPYAEALALIAIAHLGSIAADA